MSLLLGKPKMEKSEGISFLPACIIIDNGALVCEIKLFPDASFERITCSISKRLKVLSCACSIVTVSEPIPPLMKSSTDALAPVNLISSFPCPPKMEF